MPDEYYTIARNDAGGTARLRLSGTLDIGAREDLQKAFTAAAGQPGIEAIEVDLSAVTFLDSEALAGLIFGFSEARQAGRRFTVHGAQGLVRRVLAVTGTLTFFSSA